jgi:hypothetical protein
VVDRPGPDEYANDVYKSFDLHFSETAWSEYKQYYSVTGLGSSTAANVQFDARIVEEDAYATTGLSASPLAPAGLEPLPWLAWATLPALLIPWMLRRRTRTPRLPMPAAAGTWPTPGAASAAVHTWQGNSTPGWPATDPTRTGHRPPPGSGTGGR